MSDKDSNTNKQDPAREKAGKERLSPVEDGRLNEWSDRARVATENDIDPEAKTNAERDFEPERKASENRTDDKVY